MVYFVHMRYLLFLCFFFFVFSAEAAPLSNPSILFLRAIEPESGRGDIGFDVLPVDGGAIISGSTSVKGGLVDGLVLRVNDQGDVKWRKVYGGSGLDLIFSCLPDSDGFVCVGFKAPTGESGMKAMDGWILRIDGDGNITWEHTYGGAGEDRLTGIRKTGDGWIAVGHNEENEKIRAWVLRIDNQGKETQTWTYESSLPTKGLDVLPLADGGFVFVGGEGETREGSDGFVIRIDASGRKVWAHSISGPGFQVGYHLQPFQDGSFLVVGYGATENQTNHEAYVLRISAEGKVQYHKTFGGTTHDRATNALILENDSIVVIGQTQRSGAQDEDSGWDMIVHTLDAKATSLWSSRFGGDGVEFGRAVKGVTNNLWLIGHTTSQGGSKVLMIRMDASSLL